MTEFIITGRAGGKTRHLLQRMLEEDDLYYFTHSAQAADYAFDTACRMAEEQDIPLEAEEIAALRKRFIRHRGPGMSRDRRIVVDNLDLILAQMFGYSRVEAVTATGTITSLTTPEGNPE